MALSTGLSLSRCCCSASAKAAFLEIRGVLSNQHNSRRVTRKHQRTKYRESATAFEVDDMAVVVVVIVGTGGTVVDNVINLFLKFNRKGTPKHLQCHTLLTRQADEAARCGIIIKRLRNKKCEFRPKKEEISQFNRRHTLHGAIALLLSHIYPYCPRSI